MRVQENFYYHEELIALATDLGLKSATAKAVPTALAIPSDVSVLFLLSVPSTFKSTLLAAASLLVYTPRNEHFGIVPLEAMLAGTPVLAANEGGPVETVTEGVSGWLRNVKDVPAWTDVMREVLTNMSDERRAEMGRAGRLRVEQEFSDTKMASRLQEALDEMMKAERTSLDTLPVWMLGVGVVGWLVGEYALRKFGAK
jgi:alpha-1,3/alpha-1,6-mannosyltransferase